MSYRGDVVGIFALRVVQNMPATQLFEVESNFVVAVNFLQQTGNVTKKTAELPEPRSFHSFASL
jgi:hypothetical protein